MYTFIFSSGSRSGFISKFACNYVRNNVYKRSVKTAVEAMGDGAQKNQDVDNMNSAVKKCKVLIIGAGMAGLSAANHLLKNGLEDFHILEARSRIGGRIISMPMNANERVELGANWIHGVLGNPMFEIAMGNGLVDIMSVPKPHKVIAATEDGKQVPFGILHEIYEAYVCFLRRCEEYFLCQYLPPPDIYSVGEHINLEASLYLERLSNEEQRLRRLIFDCLMRRETCISGCHSMDEIDLLELGSYEELQGGNVALPNGYSAILEPMKRQIPPDRISTSAPVTKIRWKNVQTSIVSPGGDSGIDDPGDESDDSDKTVIEDGVDNIPGAEKPSSSGHQRKKIVEVACGNGDVYHASHIICTIPLGVLKQNARSLFEPPLPEYKLESIDRLLFGTVDKIFLQYTRPFLNPGITEIMFLWDTRKDPPENVMANWYKKIYSFTKVSETLLVGWISGREAEYMETLSFDVIASKCTEILRKFLNDPYVPEPEKCICTSWHSQTYTRGSYTAIAVGASQADIEQLATPLYANSHMVKPTIAFAGEHTHSNFYSTVHGAYLSGRTAAQYLLIPDEPTEVTMECGDTNDLSSWIQGISLE